MSEVPATSRSRLSSTSLGLLWTGIFACAALCLLLLVTRAELIQGQIADVPTTLLVLIALLVGVLCQGTARAIRLTDVLTRPRSLLLVSVAAFVVLAVGSLIVFGTTPLSSDEQTHLFQARLFAQFKLMAQYPPGLLDRVVPDGFKNVFILVSSDGRAMSVYWPGWALLMTPFVWIGAPWLLGPTMASIGLYVVGRLSSLLAGAQAAAVAVLLTATSGAFVVTGMSLYPAGGYLTLNLLFAWLLLRGGRRDTVIAGLVGGLALNLNNPVPHALFALPWLLWLVWDPTRRSRLGWLAIGYAPWVAVFFAWFLATSSLGATAPGTTSSFWLGRLPLLLGVPSLNVVGFRFWELVRVWTWGAPGLLVLAAIGWWQQPRNSGPWILGVAFGVTVLLYAFFPEGQGLGYGARYYQSPWGALPVLAAMLLVRPGSEAVRRVALVAAIAGLILVVPLQLNYARDLAQVGYPPLQALETPGADLYFVDTTVYGDPPITANVPSLSGRVVLVSFGPAADQEIVDRYFPGARLVIRNAYGSGYSKP